MISLGPTSDLIVAGMLAVSQLITPVPPEAAQEAERAVQERQSCQKFAKEKADFDGRNCEAKRANRQDFRAHCQNLENQMNRSEILCATDKEAPAVLGFQPRPLAQYLAMTNNELVDQLHLICNVIQDRIFLDPKDWKAGKMADRDQLSSKLVILQKPDLQGVVAKIVQEAADGKFQVATADKVVTALCHWKVDRAAVAKQIDFTGGLKYLSQLLDELPNVDQLPDLPQASFVYDDTGQRIGEIFDEEFITRNGKRYIGQVHRRRIVSANEIPRMLFNAFVSIEDKRFYEHKGFDFESIRRLLFGGLEGAKGGGSTFTMQLVKNVFFDQDVEKERATGLRTLNRKIKEILTLPRVEGRYSKDEILTYYLNLINLTPNAQGVRMASMDLFGKSDLHQLTIDEMALLAAMPKGASQYNPRRFPDQAKDRRNVILQLMADQKYLSQKDSDRLQAQPILLFDPAKEELARTLSRFYVGHLTNHFFDLKKKNLRDPRWTMGGFDIKTPLNLRYQQIVTHAVQDGLLAYEKSFGRYRYKPWVDDKKKNINIAPLMMLKHKSLVEALKALRPAHPYPDTDWLIGAKAPGVRGRWVLETGDTVDVQGGDRGNYNRLKNYDAVILAPEISETGKITGYHLASGTQVEGASIMIDIATGDVLALSGGFTSGAYGKYAQNNRATMAMRQIGSTIKPYIYLYGVNHGIKANQIVGNFPVRFPKIPRCPYRWSPGNYHGEGGTGTRIPLATALAKSINRAALSVFLTVADVPFNKRGGTDLGYASPGVVTQLHDTLYKIYSFAAELGAYPNLQDLWASGYRGPCLPFLLGAQETTPLRMAQAYATIANGGLKREAVFLREVLKDDQPLVVDESTQKRDEVTQYRYALSHGIAHAPEAFGAIDALSPMAVATVRSLMQGVLRDGTAVRLKRWADLIAGKTGTTNDSKDVWFVGFNNRIAVATWVGYDDTTEYSSLGGGTGASIALPIFESIMETYYRLHPEELNDPLPAPADTYDFEKDF